MTEPLKTLVLTSGYQPYRVIPWEEAVCLLVTGKISVTEEYEEQISSPSVTMGVPAVVVLKKHVPLSKRSIRFSRMNVLVRDSFTCQYCLDPSHRVLTADLRWVPLGDLKVGDPLIGFEEEASAPGGRRYELSTVVSHVFEKASLYRVTLQDGTTFKATAEHQWLAKMRGVHGWCQTTDLLGKAIPRLLDPWKTEDTRDAGWLAGIFDGEGWLTSKGFNLAVAQNPGLVLDHIRGSLVARDYSFGEGLVSGRCVRLNLTGGVSEKARFIGEIRPQRLLADFRIDSLGRLKSLEDVRVEEVSPVGGGTIVKMKTSSATFIAEGFPHHNCGTKKPAKLLNYDHVIPRCKGGRTVWENIVAACYPCNGKKGSRTPSEAGMTLRSRPHKPAHLLNYFDYGGEVHPLWKPYLAGAPGVLVLRD